MTSKEEIQKAIALLNSEGYRIYTGMANPLFLIRTKAGNSNFHYSTRRSLNRNASTRYRGKLGFIPEDAQYCEIDLSKLEWIGFPFSRSEPEAP